MTFHIITILLESIKNYFDSSILARAQENKLINVKFYNPRDYTEDKHKKVDDSPFGGGAGMVFKLEPIVKTVLAVLDDINVQSDKKKRKTITTNRTPRTIITTATVVLFAPAGKQFTQETAKKLAKENGDIIFICGRYEGIDARLKQVLKDLFSSYKPPAGGQNTVYKILELSVGPYILTGGELPAAVITDAISRHIPGVLGRSESLEDERGIGIPAYTRPEVFELAPLGGNKKTNPAERGKQYKIPKVLASGDHKKIEEWKRNHATTTVVKAGSRQRFVVA